MAPFPEKDPLTAFWKRVFRERVERYKSVSLFQRAAVAGIDAVSMMVSRACEVVSSESMPGTSRATALKTVQSKRVAKASKAGQATLVRHSTITLHL